jgi:hypothetical protein
MPLSNLSVVLRVRSDEIAQHDCKNEIISTQRYL